MSGSDAGYGALRLARRKHMQRGKASEVQEYGRRQRPHMAGLQMCKHELLIECGRSAREDRSCTRYGSALVPGVRYTTDVSHASKVYVPPSHQMAGNFTAFWLLGSKVLSVPNAEVQYSSLSTQVLTDTGWPDCCASSNIIM